MVAILKREFSAYFNSPIGYVFLAVFYVFAGFFFFLTSLVSDTSDLSGVYSGLFTILLFLIPILTMRLMSEDRRHKTDQALLTAPITLASLVLGKFLAALAVYLMGLAITLVFGLVVSFYTTPYWAIILGNFAATLLLGMALISIGLFISAMTESQLIAAIGGFSAGLFLLLVDVLNEYFSNSLLVRIIGAISFYSRYQGFFYGIFRISDVLFFLGVCVIFLFLTMRVIDKRRWA